MSVLLLCIVIACVLMFVAIPWNGNMPFRKWDQNANTWLKYRHSLFKVPLDAKVCASNLKSFGEVMDELGIEFWLSEGTALGAVRDEAFIAHDDDVDCGMWERDRPRFLREAIPMLRKRRFSFDFDMQDGTFIGLSRDGEKVDVDFVGEGLACMACKTRAARCTNCDEMMRFLHHLRPIKFAGGTYLCPSEAYLAYLYGDSWRTPLRTK